MPPTQQKETTWKVCSVFPHRIIEHRPEIKDDADQFAIAIFGGPKRFERAAKVVQAVNSHATLVAALEAARHELVAVTLCGDTDHAVRRANEVIAQIDSALSALKPAPATTEEARTAQRDAAGKGEEA